MIFINQNVSYKNKRLFTICSVEKQMILIDKYNYYIA